MSSDALSFLNTNFLGASAFPAQQFTSIPAAGPHALPFVASYPLPAQVPLNSNSGIASAAAASAFAPMAIQFQQPLAQPLAFNAIPFIANGQQIQIANPGAGFGNGASAAPIVIQLVLAPQPPAAAAAAAPKPQPMMNMLSGQGMAMAAPMAPAPSGVGGGGGGDSQAMPFLLDLRANFFDLRDEIHRLMFEQQVRAPEIFSQRFNQLVDIFLEFKRVQARTPGLDNSQYLSAINEMVGVIQFYEDKFEELGWFKPPCKPTEADSKEASFAAAAANDPEEFYLMANRSYTTAGPNEVKLQEAFTYINNAIARKSDNRFFSLRARIYHHLSKLSVNPQRNIYIDSSLADFEKIGTCLIESDMYTYIWALVNKLKSGTVPDSNRAQMVEKLGTLIAAFEKQQDTSVKDGRRKEENVVYNLQKMKEELNGFRQNSAMAAPMPVSFGGGGGGGGGWNPTNNPLANVAVEMELKQVMSTDALLKTEKLFYDAQNKYRAAIHKSKHPDVIVWLYNAFNEINRAIELGGSHVKFFRLRTYICDRLNYFEKKDRSKSQLRLERCRIALEDFKKIPERNMEDQGTWVWLHIAKYHLLEPFSEEKSVLLPIITTGLASYEEKINASTKGLPPQEISRLEHQLKSIRKVIGSLKNTFDNDMAARGNGQPANAAYHSNAAAAAAAAPPRPAASASAQPNPAAAAAAAAPPRPPEAAPAISSAVTMEIDSGSGPAPKESGTGQAVKMELY